MCSDAMVYSSHPDWLGPGLGRRLVGLDLPQIYLALTNNLCLDLADMALVLSCQSAMVLASSAKVTTFLGQ